MIKKLQNFIIIAFLLTYKICVSQNYLQLYTGLNFSNIKGTNNLPITFNSDLAEYSNTLVCNSSINNSNVTSNPSICYFDNNKGILYQSNMDESKVRFHIGISLGLGYTHFFKNNSCFKSGLIFNQFGASGFSDFYDANQSAIGSFRVSVNNNYFSLPFLIGKKTKGKKYFFVDFGCLNSLLLSSFSVISFSENIIVKNTHNLKQYNFAALSDIGMGISISPNSFLNLKTAYVHSFTTSLFAYRTVNFQIEYGYKF